MQNHILNDKQCRSRSVGFFRSQLIWISTVCKGRVYPGSAGQGLKSQALQIGISAFSFKAEDKILILPKPYLEHCTHINST